MAVEYIDLWALGGGIHCSSKESWRTKFMVSGKRVDKAGKVYRTAGPNCVILE